MRIQAHLNRYAPELHMCPHVDGCWRLSVLVQGEISESADSTVRLNRLGRASLKAPDFLHDNHFGADGTLIVSAVLADGMPASLGFDIEGFEAFGWHSTDRPSLQGLRLASALARRDGAVAEDALRRLLAEFAAPNRAPDAPPCVRRVLGHLAGADTPGLDHMAAESGMHPVSLNRAFRRVYGCSITAYRQRRRVTAAARALVETRDDLTEVALAHGFSDLSHLTRLFSRELDVPPGAFRRSMEQLRAFRGRRTAWTVGA